MCKRGQSPGWRLGKRIFFLPREKKGGGDGDVKLDAAVNERYFLFLSLETKSQELEVSMPPERKARTWLI